MQPLAIKGLDVKILILGGDFNLGAGTERVGSMLANGLSEAGYEVILASIVNGEQPFFNINKEIQLLSLGSSKGNALYRMPKNIAFLRKQLKEHQVDILIVVETLSVLLTLPAVVGLPIKHICWEHFNFNSDLGKKRRRIARQLAARYCDAVVTLTERDKEYWLAGTKHKQQITAIANPCPFSVQSNIKQANTKTVLAVGRLTYQKGFDLLLQAWLKISKEVPDWRLQIVGEGEDREKLQQFIADNNLTSSVELVGNSNNMEAYYRQAEIFCLSSRFEGFPMVLLETLCFGLPVVSFDCDTGPAEILDSTGSILVPAQDINQFAAALLQLMNDEQARNAIHLKSKEKAQHYQPAAIMELWQQELKKIVHHKKEVFN
mgnify:CR=1 FL=1